MEGNNVLIDPCLDFGKLEKKVMRLEYPASAKPIKISYDLNSLLKVANVLIFILSFYLYYIEGANEYVNAYTIALAGLLVIENIGMLHYEKRRNNPFIIILVFLVTFFYIARIATLISIPQSITFQRDSITSKDLNYALTFIFSCNASMLLGFYVSKALNLKRKNLVAVVEPVTKVRNAIMILMILIFSLLLGSQGISGELSAFITAIFFHQQTILLFTFTFITYHYSKISVKVRGLLILLVLAFVLLSTLSGSRSGILTAGYLLLISVLVVKQRVLVGKKILIICLILIPISIYFFIFATFNRSLEMKETSVVNILHMMNEGDILDKEFMERNMGLIYERTGFLDYSSTLIANNKMFAEVINVRYYILSIIDNVLTPGFDIFNTLKASLALGYIVHGQAIPTKQQAALNYQSDQMGIYGEYYVLFFGYPALIVFFFFAFIFQRIYDDFGRINFLLSCLYRSLVLSIFFICINSFGIDWTVFELFGTVCTSFLFAKFYVNRNDRKERKELIQVS